MAVAPAFASRSAVLACTLIFAAPASGVKAQESPIALMPHRAVYDLTLGETRGNAQVVGSARAHSLRLRRQRLRWLYAKIPPSLRA
jgi:hypothetical protein